MGPSGNGNNGHSLVGGATPVKVLHPPNGNGSSNSVKDYSNEILRLATLDNMSIEGEVLIFRNRIRPNEIQSLLSGSPPAGARITREELIRIMKEIGLTHEHPPSDATIIQETTLQITARYDHKNPCFPKCPYIFFRDRFVWDNMHYEFDVIFTITKDGPKLMDYGVYYEGSDGIRNDVFLFQILDSGESEFSEGVLAKQIQDLTQLKAYTKKLASQVEAGIHNLMRTDNPASKLIHLASELLIAHQDPKDLLAISKARDGISFYLVELNEGIFRPSLSPPSSTFPDPLHT